VLLLITLLATLQAQPDLPVCSAPHLELATRSTFTLCHDTARKVPAWTAYTLTPQQLTTPSHPRPSRFREDNSLRTPGAQDRDYTHTGFHRGHLVPALDRANSPETFLLGNAAPQTPSLNLGKMRQIENLIRNLAATSDSVTVITGTLFESPAPETIGLNQVAIPTHFFKAILIHRNGQHSMLAAILPNSHHISEPLTAFLTTVDEVEHRSSLDLFASLPDAVEAALEATMPVYDHTPAK